MIFKFSNKMKNGIALCCLVLVLAACGKDRDAADMEYPVIDISFAEAFPVQCSVIERGGTFVLKARLTDNVALGSYGVDIHHNFDQHSHSTEVAKCELAPVKTPVKPFLFIRSYSIPEGLLNYETDVEITVPDDVDPGDYHFMIQVTDKEGWGNMVGLSIKII